MGLQLCSSEEPYLADDGAYEVQSNGGTLRYCQGDQQHAHNPDIHKSVTHWTRWLDLFDGRWLDLFDGHLFHSRRLPPA